MEFESEVFRVSRIEREAVVFAWWKMSGVTVLWW